MIGELGSCYLISMIESIEKILSPKAREFLDALHRQFQHKRMSLLEERQIVQLRLNKGFLPECDEAASLIRENRVWKVVATPSDLQRRWVEITGPVERKMMINAFNSGADVFMADFEDALSPTWKNVIEGQAHLVEAVRGTLDFVSLRGKLIE